MNDRMVASELVAIAREMTASTQPVVHSRTDAIRWFEWLKRNGLEFHMDDSPEDIRWSKPVSPVDVRIIQENWAAAWRAFRGDPEALWAAYGKVVGLTWPMTDKLSAEPFIANKLAGKILVKEEFKVGDILDPQGKTNMVGLIKITGISGNTIKFVDSEGTEYYGMQRSLVRSLVNGGSWKRVAKR